MSAEAPQAPKQQTINFNQFIGKECEVSLVTGSSIRGVVKGWDILNIVLHNAVFEGETAANSLTPPPPRQLGEVLIRLVTVLAIYPTEGCEATDNPFFNENAQQPTE